MKINNTPPPLGITRSDPSHSGKQRHKDPADQVQLSGLATQIVASRESKMNQLQFAIDAGSYKVSPDAIAQSIIADATQKLGTLRASVR